MLALECGNGPWLPSDCGSSCLVALRCRDGASSSRATQGLCPQSRYMDRCDLSHRTTSGTRLPLRRIPCEEKVLPHSFSDLRLRSQYSRRSPVGKSALMFRSFPNAKRVLDSLLNLITDLVVEALLFFCLLFRSRTLSHFYLVTSPSHRHVTLFLAGEVTIRQPHLWESRRLKGSDTPCRIWSPQGRSGAA